MSAQPGPLEWAALATALTAAWFFKPWWVWRHRPLQNPWLGAMVLLPWVWWLQQLLPNGVPTRLSGICLLVLMFGWPLAMWSLPLIAAVSALIRVMGPQHWLNIAQQPMPVPPDSMAPLSRLHWFVTQVLEQWVALVPTVVWSGVIPGTLALGIGLALRRWLPHHLFVYILGRGFLGTVLAMSLTGLVGWAIGRVPASMDKQEWLLAHWLLGWGEAFSTGMLTAIFVAFKPEWLLTYSDARYLPPPSSNGGR